MPANILSSNLVTVPLLDTLLGSYTNPPSPTKRVQLLSTKLAILTNRPSQPRRGQPFEVEIQILRTRLDLAAAYLSLVSSALTSNTSTTGLGGRVRTTMATNSKLNAISYNPVTPNIGDLKRAENELGVVEKECKGMIKRYSRLVRLDKDHEGDRREEDRVYDSDHAHSGKGNGRGSSGHPTPTESPTNDPDSHSHSTINTSSKSTSTLASASTDTEFKHLRSQSPGVLTLQTSSDPRSTSPSVQQGTPQSSSAHEDTPTRPDINGEIPTSRSRQGDGDGDQDEDEEPEPHRNASTDTNISTATSTSASTAKSVLKRSSRLRTITEIRIEGMRMMMLVEERLGRADRRDRLGVTLGKLETEL